MNLLDLPLKIRRQILEILLTRSCPVDVVRESDRIKSMPSDLRVHRCSDIKCCCPVFSVSILRACKQIYSEAIDILHASNKIILSSRSPDEMPLSQINIQRIRFLQLSISRLCSMEDLPDYERMIDLVNLSPQVHLTIDTDIRDETIMDLLIEKLSSIAPVRSCALGFRDYPESKSSIVRDLGIKLTIQSHRQFPKYNDLPLELRRHILGFTDLVQNYQVWSGEICYIRRNCCRHCSDTLSPCCCNPIHGNDWWVWDRPTRFSSRCQCKVNPISLLQVSRSFRAEALVVLLARGRFVFGGELFQQSSLFPQRSFFDTFQRYLPRLRNIAIQVSLAEMRMQHVKLDWNNFVEWLVLYCNLPLVSVTMLGTNPDEFYEGLDDDSYPYDDLQTTFIRPRGMSTPDWRRYEECCLHFELGLQKLLRNGLKKLNFRFLHELESRIEEYTNPVIRGIEEDGS